MALDNLLKIVSARNINTGAGTSDTSPEFDFSTSLGAGANKIGFAEGATFVVTPTGAPAVGALPISAELQISLDGTNWRGVCKVHFTNAQKEQKSARFGLLDYVPEAAVIAGTDRPAALDLRARVVSAYTTSAGSFIFDAFIAGPQHQGPFVE